MVEITNDEMTVLALTYSGESVMAIGRWEAPCEHLVELGLLERHDKFNHALTEKGRQVYEKEQTSADDNLAKALIERHNAGVAYRKRAEAIAQEIVDLAKEVHEAMGDNVRTAADKILKVLRDRVMDVLP